MNSKTNKQTMKKSLFYLFIVAALMGSESCKKDKNNDPDVCSTSWAAAIQDETSVLANAANAYGTSQTVANCNAYKTAFQAYINALKPYSNCTTLTGTNKQEWQEALNEAQEVVNQLNCQ